MTAEDIWDTLDAYARTLEPEVRDAFRLAIERVRADLTEEELAEIVRTGDLRIVLDRLDLGGVKMAYRNVIMRAATADPLAFPLEIHFDVLGYNAIRVLQTAELALVHTLTQQVQDGIKQFLVDGLRNGVNPRETALNLRGIVGLSARESQAVANYRALLTGGAKGQPYMEALRRANRDGRFDRSILNAITDKTPLKPEQVARQVARYEAKTLKLRAETIARTNTMDALEVANRLQWQQAITEGKVDEGDLVRFWHTARDERTCPICAQIPLLNPLGVAFGQPFLLPGGGTILGPTAHPNCRCIVLVKIAIAKAARCEWARTLSGLLWAA